MEGDCKCDIRDLRSTPDISVLSQQCNWRSSVPSHSALLVHYGGPTVIQFPLTSVDEALTWYGSWMVDLSLSFCGCNVSFLSDKVAIGRPVILRGSSERTKQVRRGGESCTTASNCIVSDTIVCGVHS